ncbi:MAG: GlsB/YeaQ/YmgE family stress response membrane protein [Solirubrobacteraceae bacterium]
MEFIWMLIIGLIAGAIAKFIMPGKDPGGIIVTILIGIAGAFVGGYLFQTLGIGGEGPAGLIGAVVGALILLAIYRLVMGRRVAGPRV